MSLEVMESPYIKTWEDAAETCIDLRKRFNKGDLQNEAQANGIEPGWIESQFNTQSMIIGLHEQVQNPYTTSLSSEWPRIIGNSANIVELAENADAQFCVLASFTDQFTESGIVGKPYLLINQPDGTQQRINLVPKKYREVHNRDFLWRVRITKDIINDVAQNTSLLSGNSNIFTDDHETILNTIEGNYTDEQHNPRYWMFIAKINQLILAESLNIKNIGISTTPHLWEFLMYGIHDWNLFIKTLEDNNIISQDASDLKGRSLIKILQPHPEIEDRLRYDELAPLSGTMQLVSISDPTKVYELADLIERNLQFIKARGYPIIAASRTLDYFLTYSGYANVFGLDCGTYFEFRNRVQNGIHNLLNRSNRKPLIFSYQT